MKIALKAIQYSEFASEETSCYTANLYVDGKKIGTVSNAGHGGCDSFHGDRSAYVNADKWCRANLPKWKLETDDDRPAQMYETDLEMHCGELLSTWLTTRDLKRSMKSKIMFRKADGNVYELKHKGRVEAALGAVKRDHPTAEILNTMPLADALAIYKEIGASQ